MHLAADVSLGKYLSAREAVSTASRTAALIIPFDGVLFNRNSIHRARYAALCGRTV
jgi:hypothetical protein